jgi:hypothetical protein
MNDTTQQAAPDPLAFAESRYLFHACPASRVAEIMQRGFPPMDFTPFPPSFDVSRGAKAVGVLFTLNPWHPIWPQLYPGLRMPPGGYVEGFVAVRIKVRANVGMRMDTVELLAPDLGMRVLSTLEASVPAAEWIAIPVPPSFEELRAKYLRLYSDPFTFATFTP